MKLPVPKRPAKASWMFRPIERPSFTDSLRFPDNIAGVPSSMVSELLGKYTAMYTYATAELSNIKQQLLAIRSEQYVRKNDIQRNGITYAHRKTEVDSSVRLDKTMQSLELRCHELESQELHVASRVEIFDRYIAALSRELTRRTAETRRI